MTDRQLDVRPVPVPDHIGQGTAVEQSRAVAEVLASVQAARQFPRDIERVRAEVLHACGIKAFAEKAFYSMPRGRDTITGPSVHLARELARAWGNVSHGVNELRQNLERGESEILAFAWDLERNVRSSTTYVVPHIRDAAGRRQPILRISEVYENNGNQGARRVRASIFAVLPAWLRDEAIEACRATLASGGGVPIEERRRNTVTAFARVGIDQQRIETKIGHPIGEWTPEHLTDLGVLYRSMERREVTAEEAFPVRVVAAALLEEAPGLDPAEPAADDPWYRTAAEGEAAQ